MVAGTGLNGMHTRKQAEGGQGTGMARKVETGQPCRLPDAGRYHNGRMDMARNQPFELSSRCIGTCRMMHKQYFVSFKFRYHRHLHFIGNVGRKSIVVAQNEGEPNRRKIISPFCKPIPFLIGPAVKKIACEQHFLWPEKLDGIKQTLKVFAIHLLRHGNPFFTEMPGFAEVQVRKDKRLLLFPIQAPGGVQYKSFFFPGK